MNIYVLGILLCGLTCQMAIADSISKNFQNFRPKLLEALQKDITDLWIYKDMYQDRKELMLDQGLINRARRNLAKNHRLRELYSRAVRGEDVHVAVVGGSISRGQPFVEEGDGKRVYFNALQDWWNQVVFPITGSAMFLKDLSIGGIGSDYFANCLPAHLPPESNTNLVLWELSGNDLRRYKYQHVHGTQPLEQFLRNVLLYPSKPAVLLLNFFKGKDFLNKRGCQDLDSQGEVALAKYYNITELSWSTSVCPFLQHDQSGLAFDYLFARDHYHPSIAAHAQMAYILTDYIRDQFVKAVNNKTILQSLEVKSVLPYPVFRETYTGPPLCYTFLKVDSEEPRNTLELDVTSSPAYELSTIRSSLLRQDIIAGLKTLAPNQIINLHFIAPSYAAIQPFKRLSILSFSDSGSAVAQLDNREFVPLLTNKYDMPGTITTVPAINIGPGDHELRLWSKEKGFLILAIMLG